MPPKKPRKSQAKLKQGTLFGHFSSPTRPLLQKSKSKRVSDQESELSVSPTKRKRGRDAEDASDGGGSDSDVGGIKFEPKALVDEAKLSPAKRRRVVVESDDEDSSGSPVLVTKKLNVKSRSLKSSKTKSSRKSQPVQQVSDSESDIPVVRRSRLRKGPRGSSPPEHTEEDDELEEEHILESRLRSRHKKTAFQRNLERLKRKKQGKPMESTDSEEQEDESENDNDRPFKGAKPESEHDSLFDEDSDKSSDFIVEDDGDGAALLPAEFRPQQDLAHQFKIVFQFFVHIAVHPAVERHDFMKRLMKDFEDDYFSVALISARRKLIGLRDSLVASSVWRPEFKKSLETCPEFNLFKLDFALPQCDACHLGGRLSTLRGQLGGSSYDPLGFQDLPDEPKDSDDEDNEEETREFYFGRFCAKRTRVYHEISHWEYKLFKSVENEVDELHVHKQSDGFVRVAYAGGKKPPEDLDDADGICEWLDERKFIDIEWQNIKELMERARQLESGANGNDSD